VTITYLLYLGEDLDHDTACVFNNYINPGIKRPARLQFPNRAAAASFVR